jgi:hypothetical protein
VPSIVKDRFDVYRFFNGISSEGKEGLDIGRTRIPLVKTFLLEHVSSRNGRDPKSPVEIFHDLGTDVRSIDETFYELSDWQKQGEKSKPKLMRVGYVEQYDERFLAYYTAEKADKAIPRVNRWVTRSPELDSTWFSGHLLHSLWDRDVSQRGEDRFGRLAFRHDSVFDMPVDASDEVIDADDLSDVDEDDSIHVDDRPDVERRRIRSEIRDRIGPIRAVLARLQETYTPLNALYGLRIPSSATRGSHDLYQEGRITNRSDSFEDHRNTVRYLYRLYDSVLRLTEESAWFAFEEETATNMRTSFKGVPLIIHFSETLSDSTFNRWISLAFRKRNVFRLWGDPIRLGPTKVHVYGADRHLWQPINLEMSADRLIAILPKGTCGNTFHRLVTNVQRYVCPKIDAWLGAKPFDELMAQSQGQATTPSEAASNDP